MRWTDIRQIAIALEDAHPAEDNVNLRFTDLRNWVLALPGFNDNPNGCNEKILEAIQAAWLDEREWSRPLRSLDDTRALAQEIAPTLKAGDVLALKGDLGAGKTTFVQYLVRALSADTTEVTSPTFTLVQDYPVTLADGTHCSLYHYDLYRVESPRELEELGLDETEGHVSAIEWPERLIDTRRVTMVLSFALDKQGARSVTVEHL